MPRKRPKMVEKVLEFGEKIIGKILLTVVLILTIAMIIDEIRK